MLKKSFSLILTAVFLQFNLAAFGAGIEDEAFNSLKNQNLTKPAINQESIKDDLPTNLNKGQSQKPQTAPSLIEDKTVESLKNKNLEKPVFKQETVKEEIPVSNLKGEQTVKPKVEIPIIEDKAVNQTLKAKVFREQNSTKPVFKYQSIDYDTDTLNVPVSSVSFLSIKSAHLDEGTKVNFRIAEDVMKNNMLFIKKDTPAIGIIETITKSSSGGDPEEMIIGRFFTKDANENIINLSGQIQKKGANRALWIRPLVWIGCASFFGTPLVVLLAIKGGRVKIKPEQKFILTYDY